MDKMTGSFFVHNGKYQGEYIAPKTFHGRGTDLIAFRPAELLILGFEQEHSGSAAAICTMEIFQMVCFMGKVRAWTKSTA